MGRVTSKLQVTVPKVIADRYRIKPGDEIEWIASGDSIRVHTRNARSGERSVASRLRLFDAATKRQEARGPAAAGATGDRGWRREDLYDRGRTR
jgi:bifunctional DNA-binding transcriptional regulator/antitoxin component of YhaV-PrlF toxin-antitoxin module